MLLFGAVAALGLFDLVFVASNMLKGPREWVVRYPALEASQRSHPEYMLFGSHGWDKRVPVSSVIDPEFDANRPSMLRDILSCKPARVVMEWETGLRQMPVRFYLSANQTGSAIGRCVRRKLPSGYVMEAA